MVELGSWWAYYSLWFQARVPEARLFLVEPDPRNLEVGLGRVLTQWDGPRGQVFQLLEGSLYLADRRVGGLVLDMARGSSADSPRGGDWAFLFGARSDTLPALRSKIAVRALRP